MQFKHRAVSALMAACMMAFTGCASFAPTSIAPTEEETLTVITAPYANMLTGDTASNAIRRFLMHRARNLIVSGHTVSETAAMLGFDYPQHFTRMFKKYYGLSPRSYAKRDLK